MRHHEQNMRNGKYVTVFVDHNVFIVTRMDVKVIVKLYCLSDQIQEQTEIRHMTFKKFKTKTFMKFLPQPETLKLDAIYVAIIG